LDTDGQLEVIDDLIAKACLDLHIRKADLEEARQEGWVAFSEGDSVYDGIKRWRKKEDNYRRENRQFSPGYCDLVIIKNESGMYEFVHVDSHRAK